MKKMDIERMQRLEDMIETRDKQLVETNERYLEELKKNLKLQGANEALTELVVRLKKGE